MGCTAEARPSGEEADRDPGGDLGPYPNTTPDADAALDEESDDDEGIALAAALEPIQAPGSPGAPSGAAPPVIRPGIVHRLDKGTTGLLVVAKSDTAHAHLADQFKAHTARSGLKLVW